MGEIAVWNGGRLVGGPIERLAPRLGNLGRDDEIGSSTALLPANACEAIIAEAEDALTPCGDEIGKRQATIMLAVFAGARVGHRAESEEDEQARDIYVRAVCAAFARMPAAVAKAVVDDVVMTHRFGNPLPGDLTARAEKILKPIRDAAFIAWRHQREHARRSEARRRQEEEDARIAADPIRDRSALDALLARLDGAVRMDTHAERQTTEAQRVARTLSAVDRPVYWRLIGEGATPSEAAKISPTLSAEAAE